MGKTFMSWLARDTGGHWWIDSGVRADIDAALKEGVTGVTLNPLLDYKAIAAEWDFWQPVMRGITLGDAQSGAEAVERTITSCIADKLHPVYEETKGRLGCVCAQVNPALAYDAEAMHAMARRLSSWRENIVVKLPGTHAALEAMETCVAEGISVVMTVSFALSQVLAIAERYEKALARAAKEGKPPGRCYDVIMIGRLDDYLREAARDSGRAVSDGELLRAGVAVTKRAYQIFREKNYRAVLLPSGMRAAGQIRALAGGKLFFSVSPKIMQDANAAYKAPFTEEIDLPVERETIERLRTIRDFCRAYEPDGLAEEEFIGYAPVQRTLVQFYETGWLGMEDVWNRTR